MNSMGSMNFFRTTDTTDTTIWKPGFTAFRKLQRLLQRKRHNKLEICLRLSVMRLFQVGHVVQTRRSVHYPTWHEWFPCKGKK